MKTKIKLIAKQSIEIDNLKTRLEESNNKLKKIKLLLTSIGAPLNDNINNYNKEQLKIFFKIEQIIEN